MLLLRASLTFIPQILACTVNQESNGLKTSCEFPFVFKDKIYYGCTTDTDPDGKLWCSTKTNENSEHISGQGFWGFCQNQTCLENSDFLEVNEKAFEAEQNLKLQEIEVDNRNSGVNCNCINYRKCPWSLNMMTTVGRLPRKHPVRQKLIDFVQDRICDPSDQAVRCCTDSIVPDETTSTPVNPSSTEIPVSRSEKVKFRKVSFFGGRRAARGVPHIMFCLFCR